MNIKEEHTKFVIQTYEKAKGRWTRADWTHELVHDGKVVLWCKDIFEEKQWPRYCDGQDGPRVSADSKDSWGLVCEYCAEAKCHAKLAEEYAELAIEKIKEDKWMEAKEKAYLAYDFERNYGDAPTWRPLLRAIEQAEVLFKEIGIPFN